MASDDAAFQQIVENADTAVAVVADSKILYANDACAELFGFPDRDEILRLPSIKTILVNADLAIDQGSTKPVDVKGRAFDGSFLALAVRRFPVEWEGQPAVCYQFKGPRRTSHRQLFDALDQVDTAIALFDADDQLTYSNAKYNRFLGNILRNKERLSFEDVLRLSLENGVIPDAEADPESWIRMRMENHKNPGQPTVIRRANDTWESVHEQKTDDGGILLISNDITEQKIAEQASAEANAYLKAFVENSQAAVFLKDKNARMIYVNETYREWQRVSDKDVIGKTIYHLFPKESAERIEAQDRLALDEGKSSSVESRTRFPDGVTRNVMAIRFPVVDEEGEIIGVSGFLTDISDHYRAKEELEKQTKLYTSILDHLPIAVTIKDTEGRYEVVNKQIQIWRNLPEEGLLGKTTAETYDEPDHIHLAREKQEQEVRETGGLVRRSEWIACADGKTRYLEWLKFPLVDRAGSPIGIGTIGADLTDRKTVEQDLMAAKETAELANRAKSEFLAHMSHELRTPLNAVIGFSQLMTERTFGDLGHENYYSYASDIYGAGNHLLNVISDILDISKIEAGEVALEESEIDISQLMASSVKMIRSRAEEAGLILSMKVPRNLPKFRGDELRLRQILLNLLTNSVKFTEPGGEITLAAQVSSENEMLWQVSDTGIGIPEEDLSRVTRPFEQARQGFQLSHEGTGLGLYLTQTLTEAHQGTLYIESELGKGTRVEVRFPEARTLG